VAYWDALGSKGPTLYGGRLFQNPIASDAVTFAQVRVFIPHRRLVWLWDRPVTVGGPPIGGVPGELPPLPPPGSGDPPEQPPDEPIPPDPEQPEGSWVVGRQPHVEETWNLLNQHWTVQLVPATATILPQILQTPPNVPGFDSSRFQLPDLGSLSVEDLGRINTH